MFGRQKEAPIDRRRSLAGVPVQNGGVTVEEREPGRVSLVLKVSRRAGFWGRFQPAVMERTVKLDEVGTFVFRQIDGRRDVLEIVNRFVAQYRANRREAELSVTTFMRQLAERHVISIVIK